MRNLLLVPVIAIAALGGAASLHYLNAQENHDAPKAKADDKPADDPKDFASHAELLAHFEKLHGEIETEFEASRKEDMAATAYERFVERHRETDRRLLAALGRYAETHAGAEDVFAARYDVISIAARLGDWPAVIAAADAFLAKHADDHQDMTRGAAFARGDALFNIEGREDEALTALTAVVEKYIEHAEADHARARVLRLHLIRHDVAKARALLDQIAKLPRVRDSDEESAWVEEEAAKLGRIGKELPAFSLKDEAGKDVTNELLMGKPALLWFWDTESGPSVDELDEILRVADAFKDKLTVATVSVNKAHDVWRQFIERSRKDQAEKGAGVRHLFEGRYVKAKALAGNLEISELPSIVLVDEKGAIRRFDPPGFDLERTLRAWLGK